MVVNILFICFVDRSMRITTWMPEVVVGVGRRECCFCLMANATVAIIWLRALNHARPVRCFDNCTQAMMKNVTFGKVTV